MKKVMMFLGLVTIFLLTACGSGTGNGSDDKTGTGSISQSTEQGQDEGQGQNDGQEQSSSENLANPGDDIYGDVEMMALRAAVVEILGENYWPSNEIAEDDFQEKYGLKQEMYEDYFAEEALVESSADALVIVKAAPGRAEEVEQALNAYREKMVDDTSVSPENAVKINASRIEIFGSYVCFVQLGADLTTLMDQGEEAVMARCQEENEKALDVIRTTLLK